MRRHRAFRQGSQIQSTLPTAALPHSRKYDHEPLCVTPAAVLDGAAPSLTLDAVTNHIVCGDAAAVLRKLPSDWCPCAITSPPYWNTVDYGVDGQIGLSSYEEYLDSLDLVWQEVARALMPNGKFCLNVPLLPLTKEVSGAAFGPSHTRVVLDLYSDIKTRLESTTSLQLFSLYIWEKQTTEKMFGSYPHPPNLYERNYIEFIAVFVKPGSPRTLPSTVKEFSRLSQDEWMDLTQQIWWMYPDNIPRLEGHPAPFPEALPNRLISMYTFRATPDGSFPGDIVLDPFAGSGTTSVAAKRLGRRFLGIDLNPEFCTSAYHRIQGVHPTGKVLSALRPEKRPQPQLSLLDTNEVALGKH